MKQFAVWLFFLSMLVVVGCRGVKNDGGNGIDGGLTIGLVDGPTEDADEVVITFTGVEIKPSGEPAFTVELNNPEAVDLLDYRDGERFELLDDYGLDDDTYSWVRLLVDDRNGASYIRNEDGQFPLTIEDDAADNLQINRGFTFTNDSVVDFTVEVDLRQSIYQNSNDDYIFRPILRVVNTADVATISGAVADALVDSPACEDPDLPFYAGKVVYLFEGAGAVVQDIQDDQTFDQPSTDNPIATAAVYNDDDLNEYRFDFYYVEDGDYTVAFTCFAQHDDPISDDNAIVLFETPVDVTLTNGTHSDLVID